MNDYSLSLPLDERRIPPSSSLTRSLVRCDVGYGIEDLRGAPGGRKLGLLGFSGAVSMAIEYVILSIAGKVYVVRVWSQLRVRFRLVAAVAIVGREPKAIATRQRRAGAHVFVEPAENADWVWAEI